MVVIKMRWVKITSENGTVVLWPIAQEKNKGT